MQQVPIDCPGRATVWGCSSSAALRAARDTWHALGPRLGKPCHRHLRVLFKDCSVCHEAPIVAVFIMQQLDCGVGGYACACCNW
jgi:hypothetical protein